MPPWSTARNSAHQALGTPTIQRGSTLPSALTMGEDRPGPVEGNAADRRGGSRAGLGKGSRGGRASLVTGVTHNHSACPTTQE